MKLHQRWSSKENIPPKADSKWCNKSINDDLKTKAVTLQGTSNSRSSQKTDFDEITAIATKNFNFIRNKQSMAYVEQEKINSENLCSYSASQTKKGDTMENPRLCGFVISIYRKIRRQKSTIFMEWKPTESVTFQVSAFIT